MKDINVVSIIGRLTRDVELKHTAGGVSVCKFVLAVNRSVKKGDAWAKETSFFDVTVFGELGESLQRHLQKGNQVAVLGSLRQERWDKEEGQSTARVEIVADQVQFVGCQSMAANGPKASAELAAPSDGFADDIPAIRNAMTEVGVSTTTTDESATTRECGI